MRDLIVNAEQIKYAVTSQNYTSGQNHRLNLSECYKVEKLGISFK